MEQALELLRLWRLNGPMARVGRAYPALEVPQLRRLETSYRHFMALSILRPEVRHVPHLAVDAVWHEHLLYTQGYQDFCHEVIGHFVHHKPSDGNKPTAQDRSDYAFSRELIRHHFGEEKDPDMWLAECLTTMKAPA